MMERLLAQLEKRGLDCIFLAKRENVRYISGYTGDDAFLLITAGQPYIITDPRCTEQAGLECEGYTVVNWRVGNQTVADAVAAITAERKIKAVGFEADKLPFQMYDQLQAATGCELVPATGMVEELRAVKSPREIQCLKAACEISCRAFERIVEDIRVGRTEKELAARLSLYMVEEGADTQPYGNILISGSRTSLLHGIPSAKAVEYGDFVLMDFGCQYKGYLSDMTRTVVVGKADARQREVYALEQQMMRDSLAAMKAGAGSQDIYKASTKAIMGTEYYDYHYPGIGHGIGMFVHELPSISVRSDAVLQENNVVTVEPGIYIPGWGGVRIEDQVLITNDGYENMIRATWELLEL